jgi:hypothetical protein
MGGVAAAFGLYAGLTFLIPLIFAGAAYFILFKLRPARQEIMMMTALTVAQLAWFVLGVAIAPEMISSVGIDIVATAILVAWLLYGFSTAAIITLAIFEAIGLIMNGFLLAATDPASTAFRALLVHIVLRVAIIGYGIAYFVGKRLNPDQEYADDGIPGEMTDERLEPLS